MASKGQIADAKRQLETLLPIIIPFILFFLIINMYFFEINTNKLKRKW